MVANFVLRKDVSNFCEHIRVNLALKYGSCILRTTAKQFPIQYAKCKIFFSADSVKPNFFKLNLFLRAKNFKKV